MSRSFTIQLGRVYSQPIGPHFKRLFQIAFKAKDFAALVPWLMLNRRGLDIRIHPETGAELADHSSNAAWLGTRLPLDLQALS